MSLATAGAEKGDENCNAFHVGEPPGEWSSSRRIGTADPEQFYIDQQ